jgi:hypothetical protein
MVETLNPLNPNYTQGLDQITQGLVGVARSAQASMALLLAGGFITGQTFIVAGGMQHVRGPLQRSGPLLPLVAPAANTVMMAPRAGATAAIVAIHAAATVAHLIPTAAIVVVAILLVTTVS